MLNFCLIDYLERTRVPHLPSVHEKSWKDIHYLYQVGGSFEPVNEKGDGDEGMWERRTVATFCLNSRGPQ